MSRQTKNIDYLEEDEPIPGQLWFCVSFLSPEGIKNCSLRGLKIRGVYGTRQEAEKRADELHKIDPDFHVFVGEMGKWLPWDPNPNDVKDHVYQEKELNDLMKGYKENMVKSKQMQNERIKEDLNKSAKQEQTRLNTHSGSNAKDRLRNKLEAKKNLEKINNLAAKNVSEVKELESSVNELKTQVDQKEQTVESTRQNVQTLDEKLAKIQELYKKLN